MVQNSFSLEQDRGSLRLKTYERIFIKNGAYPKPLKEEEVFL